MTDDIERAPAFISPTDACDSHFHVFGEKGRYPYSGKLRYEPPHAPWENYAKWAEHVGISRWVFVQPSAYGTDNSCMLDTMKQVGVKHCRGIIDLEPGTSANSLAAWHQLGVRGIRINVSPIHPMDSLLCSRMQSHIANMDALCHEMGWHLDFLLPGWLTYEMIPTFERLKVPHSLAHMGMFLAREGSNQIGFQALLKLMQTGRTWVKFTGTYRMGTAPGFTDVKPMAQALIKSAPNRIIWGSDYPHLSFAHTVGSTQLFNLLGEWAPEESIRKLILKDNPQELYGF